MFPRYVFWTVLLLTCGYALWRGRSDERLAAIVCLTASIATKFAVSPLEARYATVELGLLAIDMAALAAFVYIALRSERFWPLWVAGLQLTTMTAHVMKAIHVGLMPHAYGAAAVFWSYPILLIIAIGAWRAHRRYRQSLENAAPA